jgi:hypothetical protein
MKRRKTRKQDNKEMWTKENSRTPSEKEDSEHGEVSRFHQMGKMQCANAIDK